jgi:hypothetical protein
VPPLIVGAVMDIVVWLRGLGLGKYEAAFRENDIDEGKLVGPNNLMAGTDCGFAQGPFVQRVHPSIMLAKL